MRRILKPLVCLLLALFPLTGAGAQDEGSRIRVVWTTKPPVIDGVLDEAVWEEAALLGPLTQVAPRFGEAPTQRTEIRILTDRRHLYFGIRCFDAEPSKIVAKDMLRDSWPYAEAQINLTLDTFNDRRNAYLFNVTAAGGRADALIEGPEVLLSWDTIWFARTTIDEQGWNIEIAIPYQSVNFDPEGDAWGFNIERFVARYEEESRWADPSLDRSITDVGRSGTLEGLRGIQQGLGLDVTSSLTLRWEDEYDEDGHDTTGDPTLDTTYKLTPGLTAALTVNTDFSETQVDDRQVDLSRFALFFPERRAFFLQDALIFDFAGLKENAKPFFSRRIGRADDGEAIDIRVGAKLTGREGPLSLGFFGVNQEGNDGIESKNLAVGRISLNVLEESKIGLIATHGDPSSNDENNLVGADFQYRNSSFRGSRTLAGKAWFQHSFSSGVDGEEAAFGGELEYPNDIVNWKIGFQQIGENYYPGLGFVNRTDIRRYDGEYRYRIRPDGGFLDAIDFKLESFLVTDTATTVESGLLAFEPIKLIRGGVYESGKAQDSLKFRYEHHFERLLEPFEIHPGIFLPAETYHYDEGSIRIETNRKRILAGTVDVGAGTFFSGERLRALGELDFRPNKYFLVSLIYDHNQIWLPEGDFEVQLVILRATLQFTPDISWITLGQWDNVSDKMGFNSRFRWIIQDGREFYIIVNQDFDTRNEIRSERTEAILKLEWTFRF
jgi:hypothetical protein